MRSTLSVPIFQLNALKFCSLEMDLLWMSAYPSCLAAMVSKAAHLEYQCRKKNLGNPPNRFSAD